MFIVPAACDELVVFDEPVAVVSGEVEVVGEAAVVDVFEGDVTTGAAEATVVEAAAVPVVPVAGAIAAVVDAAIVAGVEGAEEVATVETAETAVEVAVVTMVEVEAATVEATTVSEASVVVTAAPAPPTIGVWTVVAALTAGVDVAESEQAPRVLSKLPLVILTQ